MVAKPLDEEAIFKVAVGIPSEDVRSDYLQQVCNDDDALLNRVVVLLRAHDEAPGYLESPVGCIAATFDFPPPAESPGATIGRYKLLQEIGEGGMGVVYEAEQLEPVHRKVALKVVKPGVDTREVIRRFEFERQALALMDHPNIAHMLDAGATESGRPYFVMELVEGTPVTDYCDREELTVAERLRLFGLVCQAVQHAHQKGIIHRDLKPSNVLVAVQDGTPLPKVVDFGVAKAMGQGIVGEATSTHAGQMVGTPLYMSPEQAEGNGQRVDTRSDVYSLGVVLYELLTGTTPFEKDRFRDAGFEQVCAAIRSEDPPPPSSRISTLEAAKATTISAHRKTDRVRLSHLLRSDLDWIVMKALEKDPERRYATARDLAEDVRRFLEGEPIHARPPSLLDRVGKWTRRHRTAVVSAGAIAVILLVATTVLALTQRRAVISERELAERRLAVQTGINNALAEATRLRGQVRAGALGDQTALMLARDQVQRAVALAESGRADPQLIAQVRGLLSELDQEQRDRKLLAELDKAWSANPYLANDRRLANVGSINILGHALTTYGIAIGKEPPEKVAAMIRARPEPVRGELLAALEELHVLAKPGIGIALERDDGRTIIKYIKPDIPAARDGHLKVGDEVVGIGQGRESQLVDTTHKDPTYLQKLLAGEVGTIVRLQVVRKGESESRVYELQRESLAPWLKAVVDAADTDPWRRQLREVHGLADPTQRRTALEKLADAANIEHQPVRALARLAHALAADSLRDRAVTFLKQAWQIHPDDVAVNISLSKWLPRTSPPLGESNPAGSPTRGDSPSAQQLGEAMWYVSVAVALRPDHAGLRDYRGLIFVGAKKYDEAIADFNQAIRLDPKSGVHYGNRGYAYHAKGEFDKAIVEYDHAIRLEPTDAILHHNRGCTYFRKGEFEKALADFDEAIRLDPSHFSAYAYRGDIYETKGVWDKALADFNEAIRLEPNNWAAHSSRGMVYGEKGESDKAIADFDEAIRLAPKRSPPYACKAWHLAVIHPPELRQPVRAVELAKKAVELAPTDGRLWCTLGLALYRNGQWAEAITALEKSVELKSDRDEYSWLFLSMANWQLGQKNKARTWYDKAVQWMEKNPPTVPRKLKRWTQFRAEADSLMGNNVAKPTSESSTPSPKGGDTPNK